MNRSRTTPALTALRGIIIGWVIVFLAVALVGINIPVTGLRDPAVSSLAKTELSIPFRVRNSASHGSTGQISWLIAEDHFSYPVIEQPHNNPGYVSFAEDTLTRFRLAGDYGSIGILAHNYLAGAKFFDLQPGDAINLLEEDGSTLPFLVIDIRQFQATIPTSAYSQFIDLADGKIYTSTELFLDIYGQADLLVLQTCIEKAGEDSWGRHFVIAAPVRTYSQLVWYGYQH